MKLLHNPTDEQAIAIAEMLTTLARDGYMPCVFADGAIRDDNGELQPTWGAIIYNSDGDEVATGCEVWLVDAMRDAYSMTPEQRDKDGE